MPDEIFNKLVREGIEAIPIEFREKLSNVAIVTQDYPSPSQLTKSNVPAGWTLFGLYEGIPITKRNSYYASLPDTITIFKLPILHVAKDENDLKTIVKNTVWHEIAHHFGMDEAQVRNAEKERRSRENSNIDNSSQNTDLV